MIKPTEPTGCLEKDWQKYAQDNAKWSAWIAEHPEQASAASPLPEAAGVTAPSGTPAAEPSHKHKFDPDTGMPVP
jgi:hypothetical protein